MKTRKFPLLLVLGLVLILAALCLALVFSLRMARVNRDSKSYWDKITAILPAAHPGLPLNTGDMPALELDGTDFVALLEIPAHGVRLPVTSSWQGRTLPALPGRFSGSAYDGTLVLGGFDQSRQFGFCSKIDPGVKLTLTDMTGAVFSYTVTRVDRSQSADAAWLQDPDSDLTLFCRSLLSGTYLAVRCTLTP